MHRETAAVTLGRGPGAPGDPVNAGVTFSSTFHAGGDIVYGRNSNPTWEAFEDTVGALEGGSAVSFASGMAAIDAILDLVDSGGMVVAPAGAYYGTRRLLGALGRRGVAHQLVDVTDTAATVDAARNADVLWLESPTNPMMEVCDIAAVCGGVSGGPLIVVDNTFATPMRQRPLELGADVSVHSATKLLAGHSDVLLGVAVCADAARADALREHRNVHGAVPGPMEVFLALRGVRTLAVRLDRSEASARVMAERLEGHVAVERVRYPGWGTVVSFEVAGGATAAEAVCDAVCLVVHGTSLGGVESLIERRNRWTGEEDTPEGLIRLSVGLEHVEDLWADLDAALSGR